MAPPQAEAFSNSFAVTNDSKYVVCGYEKGDIRIWNLQEKREEFCLDGHKTAPKIVIWTRDNRFIISWENESVIRIWDFQKKRQEATMEMPFSVSSMAATSDNKYIVLCSFYDDDLDTMGVFQLRKVIESYN